MNSLKDHFLLDRRSIALFRVVASLCLLVEVFLRVQGREAFYSALGLFPSSGSSFIPSIIYFSESSLVFYLVVLALTLSLAMILLGYKTKPFVLLSFILFQSLSLKSPYILDGANKFFILSFLFLFFLPAGEFFSIQKKPSHSSRFKSWWAVVFVLQICLIYFVAGASKNSSFWLIDGKALQDILFWKNFPTELGYWLRGQTGLVSFLSRFSYLIEIGVPLLFLFAFRFWRWRLVGISF